VKRRLFRVERDNQTALYAPS